MRIGQARWLSWSWLAPLALFGIANVIVMLLVKWGLLVATDDREVYRRRLQEARQTSASFMIIGHSMGEKVVPAISWSVPPVGEVEVFALTLPDASPRTHQFILEAVAFQCVRPGGKALLYLSPTDFFEGNKGFPLTIISFFSWKEFIGELLVNWRVKDMKFFLANCSIPLIRYHHELRAWLGLREEPEGPHGMALLEQERRRFRLNYPQGFQPDPYQVKASSKIIEGLRRRQVDVAIALLPSPPLHRQALGEKTLAAFREAVYSVATQHDVPVLDYLSGHTGEPYEYTADGSHFTESSRKAFSRALGEDLSTIW